MPQLILILASFVALLTFQRIGLADDSDSLNRFKNVVAPFLTTHCSQCHEGDKPEADLNLSDIEPQLRTPSQIDAWQNVLEQLVLGQMPPADEPQPSAKEIRAVEEWILARLRAADQTPTIQHKLRSPEFGNHVNHEKLFDGSQTGPAFSPPRLWRISPQIYNHLIVALRENLRREAAIHQPFPLDETKGAFADYSAQQFADSATLQLLLMNCETITQLQTTGIEVRAHDGETHRLKASLPAFQAIVESEDRPTDAQIETAIRAEFKLFLDRVPSSSELTKLVEFFRRSAKIAGNVRGLQITLTAILLKPESIYRMEIGLGPLDEHGRRRLSPLEISFAIAHAVSDKMPSEIKVQVPRQDGDDADSSLIEKNLLQLADEMYFDNPANIRRVVRQILDNQNMSTANYRMFTEDHQIGNTRVLRFFREFFGYHHATKVFKDSKRIGFGDIYETDRIVDDADQLVMHLFDQDQDVLKRLLTTDQYFVAYLGSLGNIKKDLHYIKTNVNDANFEFNTKYVEQAEAAGRHPIPIEGPSSRQYVGFYNLDHETWDYPTQQPFRMPEKKRAGILMHPAWLIAWSGNFDNDPIRRGKWIREHLLAGTIPDVPLNVNAVVPEERDQTLRTRLAVTREDYCWTCHQKMDPLGLPFERFDDFGRFRKREIVGELLTIFPEKHRHSETLPIDSSGAITNVNEPGLDSDVKDAFELVEKLAGSRRVHQSFVRHAFRFWMGRNETLRDSPTLMAAEQAYVRNGGSMKALIASLLSSDSFLYRKATASPAPEDN